jgi:S1 RNA binding domain protein
MSPPGRTALTAKGTFPHTGHSTCRGSPARPKEGAPDIAEIEVGAVIDGTVERITPYGAFLKLEDGRLGLVHISEVDRNYVKDVHDHLREGDVVQAKVLAIKEDGKIDLSIKALQDPPPPRMRRGANPEFEAMLKKFMRQSEERQVDFKRAVEHKRK